MKFSNEFWKDVLKSWNSFNQHYQKRVDNQVIWYNSQVRVAGKPIMWNDIYQKGLLYVHQLFKDKHFKTEEEVQEEFGLTPLRYNSLKTSIPSDWKTFFQNNHKLTYMPIAPHIYDRTQTEFCNSFSKRVYKYLGGDMLEIHNKYITWRQDLGSDYNEALYDFTRAHKAIYKLTNVPKFRSFQYRLLQRGLVTNIQLSKWGIKEDDLCSFCQQGRETYTHLFWECELVRKIWEQIERDIQSRYQIPVVLNAQNVIFNTITEQEYHVANFICLIVKQYIYRQKCLQKVLSIDELKAQIEKIERMEKYIATKNNKLNKHVTKWEKSRNHKQGQPGVSLSDWLQEYMHNM